MPFMIAAIADRYDSMRKVVFQMGSDRSLRFLEGGGELPFPGRGVLDPRQAEMHVAVAKSG
jgi:hypothetical protein